MLKSNNTSIEEPMTVPEVARILKTCDRTVYRLVARSHLQRAEGLRVVRIKSQSLHRLLEP